MSSLSPLLKDVSTSRTILIRFVTACSKSSYAAETTCFRAQHCLPAVTAARLAAASTAGKSITKSTAGHQTKRDDIAQQVASRRCDTDS